MLAALRTARLVGDGPVGRLSLHDFRREGVGDLDRLMLHRVQPAIPLRLVDLARFLAQLPGHRRNPSSQLAANRHPWLLIFASFLPERPARPQIASLAFTQIQPPRKPQAAPLVYFFLSLLWHSQLARVYNRYHCFHSRSVVARIALGSVSAGTEFSSHGAREFG